MRPRSSVFPALMILIAVASVVTLRSIDPTYATNQFLFFLLSLLGYLAISSIPFLWLKKMRWLIYGAVVGLLILTLVIGTATNGSLSWIRFGSYRIQPSEFLKPALLFLIGIEVVQNPLRTTKNLLRFLLFAGIPIALVLLQPDLGTTLVAMSGLAGIYFFSMPSKQFTLFLTGAGISVVVLSWLFLLQPYQKDRILTFVAPQNDPLGSGYNAQQAMIAVGSGTLWGRGFGNGIQSNLQFLPERQTDFLFATFGEETGFIGSSLLISLYAVLFFWIARVMVELDSQEKRLVALGIAAGLFAQTTINIGMNIGIMPITGVPLPLFSLGGSSLLATAGSLGIIESMRRSSYQSIIGPGP